MYPLFDITYQAELIYFEAHFIGDTISNLFHLSAIKLVQNGSFTTKQSFEKDIKKEVV